MNGRKHIIMFALLLCLSSLIANSNYQFQIDKIELGDSVPLGPVSFSSPAADTFQYIDATQATTYGTITNAPPNGMGADSAGPADDTELLEASYSDTTYTQLEYSGFGSLPSGWSSSGFTITSGLARSTTVAGSYLVTQVYNFAGYEGARFTYKHRAYDFVTPYWYTATDWDIGYYTSPVTFTRVDGVPAYTDASGAWHTDTEDMAAVAGGSHSIYLKASATAGANDKIETDDWYIYGIASETCYRFEAVFRFDSVSLGLASYVLYIDFYTALSSDDDLDFYIGTSTTPTSQIAVDKQDDFSIDVSSYITASSIYLKIADNYRSSDTVQTTAYIQRCYLFTPEAGWFDESWTRRQSVIITGSAGAGTGYQIPLTVTYDSDMQTNFGDLRFTDNDGTTELCYWVKSYTASTSAIVWVKVADDLGSNVIIYMYYGNTGASSTSSGPATFLLFDDFEDNTLNATTWHEWGTGGGTPTESGGILSYASTASWGDYGSYTLWSTNIAAVASIKSTTEANYWWMGFDERTFDNTYDGAGVDQATISYDGAKYYHTSHDGGVTNTARTTLYTSYISSAIHWHTAAVQFYESDVLKATLTTNIPTDSMGFTILSQGTRTLSWEYVYIRKCIATEPAFSSFGSETIGDFAAPTIAATSYSPTVPTTVTGLTLFAIVTDLVGVDDVWFDAIAYPAGFDDIPYHATEVGTNTWAYSFDGSDLPDGVYCFVTYAIDTKYQSVATYSMYQTIQVSVGQITCYIKIFDSLGNWIPFETFEVWRDGLRQYTDSFSSYSDVQHDILVKDRWGETLNYTTFAVGTEELVVVVDVYSFKVMSWYEDFCYFNITHGGLTYVEAIAPMETVPFRLFAGTYGFGVNYRNGTGWFSYTLNLVNSTAIVIMGDTIADVAALSAQLLDLSLDINVTLYSTNNEILTISINLDNVNTTINNQLIQVLLNITNTNTTIYQQTVDLLAAIQNTNTTLYDQTLAIILDIYNVNSTIYAQTVTLLSNIANLDSDIIAQTVTLLSSISNVNSTLFSQTITMLANIANLDSDIAAQTVTLLASIENVNSTIYAQTVTLLSNIANLDSDIIAQTVTLLASISNVNSTLYSQTVTLIANIANLDSDIAAQTVTLLASISNVNSTLYSQTVTLIANIANMNSTLYNQTVSLMTTVLNMNSTLYNQTLSILTEIYNVNSTLYSQAVTLMTYILNDNSNIYAQTLAVLLKMTDVQEKVDTLKLTVDDLQTTADDIKDSQRGETDLNNDKTMFVITLVSLVFLSIFIGGIIMWWENRKQKKYDFRGAVSGGQ